MPSDPPRPTTIGQYLLSRLQAEGANHVFGIPGDYILQFYDEMARSSIRHIGTTREDTAAFAADGYARMQGIGALAVTYGVGALNVVNAIAGAHAESSPVVVVSGAPGVGEQRDDPLLHHRFGPFAFQREIFERITCASAVLDDPVTAFRQIDRTLAAARRLRKPVYIEIPRDRVSAPGYPVPAEVAEAGEDAESDPDTLDEAVAETVDLLARSTYPAVVAGVEVHRRALQDSLLELVEKGRLPVASTLTGKSVIAERHANYLGVYEGAMTSETVRQTVERADLVIMLGVTLNDVDTGIYTAKLDLRRVVRASQGEVIVQHHRYPRVGLGDFLRALARAVQPHPAALPSPAPWLEAPGFPESGRPMSIARLIGRLNQALTRDMMVVSDTGDCLFAAIELRVHERTEFLASAFYTTMGFGVPAALGAQVARPDRRAIVLVGDGAFQMTGTELSTHARLGLAPVVIVFNNRGYSTERFLLEGPFNDIADWRFEKLGEVFGPMAGFDAPTEDRFEEALTQGLADRTRPTIINAHLAPRDPSPAMKRLTEHLSKRVGGTGR